jgi:hypothetical protein
VAIEAFTYGNAVDGAGKLHAWTEIGGIYVGSFITQVS